MATASVSDVSNGMAARRIWLSRHGESEANAMGIIGGDSSLTSVGQEYAKQLPELLYARMQAAFPASSQPLLIPVLTSTLQRTIQTAQYIPLPQQHLPELNEISVGICDNLTHQQVELWYPEEHQKRKLDKLSYRYPSGESYQDLLARVLPTVTQVQQSSESVLIVAHQAVLRCVLGLLLSIPAHKIPTFEIPQHALIELVPLADGSLSMQQFKADMPATRKTCCQAAPAAEAAPGAVRLQGMQSLPVPLPVA